MAEPRDSFNPNAPVMDEQTQAKAKAAAAQVAAGMPQINPVTGQLPDLFKGLFGITEILINDPVYGEEVRAIKAALDAGNETLAKTLINKSKWSQLDTDAQDAYLLKLKNSKLYKEKLKSWTINIKRQLAAKGLKADDATLEKIWKSEYSLKEFIDPKNYKSYDELKKRFNEVLNLDGASSPATASAPREENVGKPTFNSTSKKYGDDNLDEDEDYFKNLPDD
jgi:hypothetical protein